MDESVTFRSTAPRLMEQVRETLRFYHYAYNTEKSYVEWKVGIWGHPPLASSLESCLPCGTGSQSPTGS